MLYPLVTPILQPLAGGLLNRRARQTDIVRAIFADASPGWHWTVEQAIKANKAAGVWGVTSGWTAPQLALCQAFQDSAGTIPVYAVEQPLGLIRDTSGRGNHFYQTDPTKRPTLSALVNMLSSSGDLTQWTANGANEAFVTSDVSPTGGVVSQVGAIGTRYKSFRVPTGVTYVYSFKIKPSDPTRSHTFYADGLALGVAVVVYFIPSSGQVTTNSRNIAFSVAPLGGGWFGVTGVLSTTTAAGPLGVHAYPASGSVTLWADMDLRLAADATGTLPPYQRVTSPSDCQTVGFPHYAKFNGLNTFLESAAVDFSGTDEVTAVVGLVKQSDSAESVLIELGANSATTAGSFGMFARGASGTNPAARSHGSVASVAQGGSASPSKAVMSMTAKIATDALVLRENGTQVATSATDQGTGNFGNHKAYVGMRGGTSLPFNGRIYGMTVVGKLQPDARLLALEARQKPK